MGDGTEEGRYGDPPPGYNPFVDVRRHTHKYTPSTEYRSLTSFQVCTNDNLGKLPGWRYILSRVYIIRTVADNKKVRTKRNVQAFKVTNDVSKLVVEYINASTYGAGVKIHGKRVVPVRNMPSDYEHGLELGHVPLDENDMAEFMRLLQERDIDRFELSFSQ